MPRKSLLKIVRWIGTFFLVYGAGVFGLSILPSPGNVVSIVVWTILSAGVALFLLDMMVPGIQWLSTVVTRLPASLPDTVALTFDDGPVEPYTRQILDILDRFGAKATFFCLGSNVDAHPDLAREIVSRGHTIGNHTYNHRVLPFLSPSKRSQEIARSAEAIVRATGKSPAFVRCPKGYKSRGVVRTAAKLGERIIGFSYPIFDVQNPAPEELVGRVLLKVASGDIILMHDGYGPGPAGKRDSLVKALPAILEGFRAKGLRAVGLDGLVL